MIPYADVNLVRVPESIDFVDVASLGCRFGTAFRGVVSQGRTRPGEWVVVHGCGGVGLSAVMIAASQGANVIGVDINDETLALARSVGARHTVNALKDDFLLEAIDDLTSGGAHVSLDALGSTVTCRNSILSLRKRGRHVQVGLMVADDAAPPLPMGRVIGWELELYGSHGIQAHEYPKLLSMVERGALNPAALVRERVSLDESPAVLARMTDYDVVGISVIDRFSE
jgi:alcohol dehydrogenase